MQRLILLAAISFLMVSCQEDQSYSITGKAPGIENGTMVYVSELKKLNSRPERVDSTEIRDEAFQLEPAQVDQPNLSFLEIEGINGNVIFISENKPINLKIHKDSLRSSEVQGGKENKVLYQYLDHLMEVNRKVQQGRQEMQQAFQQQDSTALENLQETEKELMDNDKVFKKKIVTENPDAFVSVMVLSDMLSMKSYPSSEIKAMFEQLDPQVKESPLGKGLQQNLEKESAVEIGSKAPDFTAPTPEGKELSLSDNLGKVTIVDFWAAWCKPCRVENPRVVKIYEKYHDQGLEIIGVSLDRPGQKDKWLKAIEDDKLPWHQVSNLKFWDEPVARLYGVRAIPATFILDKEGIIAARDLRGDALEKKVADLLDQ